MLLACYLYVVNMSAACISVFSILFADAVLATMRLLRSCSLNGSCLILVSH